MLILGSVYCWQFVAKEGETVEPGTKVAVVSKSGEGVAHVAPSEKITEKPPPKKESAPQGKKEEKPKVETAPATEKPKAPAPAPPKLSAREPQLPPKERERRVSLVAHCYINNVPEKMFIYLKQVQSGL